MKRFFCFIAILVIIGFPCTGDAEFYKLKNEQGDIVYTDDLSRIPENQRSIAVHYEEVVSAPNLDMFQTDDESDAEELETSDDSEKMALLKELNKKKADLDAEYKRLMGEKEALEKRNDAFDTKEALESYNEKIVDLNNRIADYENRRQAFSDEVDAYNAQNDDPVVED